MVDRLKNSLPGKVGMKFIEDQSPNWAVLIAWNALFAFFPILLSIAALLGFLLIFTHFDSSNFFQGVLAAMPKEARDALTPALGGVKHQTGLLAIVGLLTLLWGGSALFGAMEQAFAVIYHTKPRDFIKQKAVGLGMIFVFTILAGIAVGTSSLLPALKHIPNLSGVFKAGIVAVPLQIALGVIAGFLLFASIYFVIPNRKQEWGKVWPGALLAGVLFELITLLFPLYLEINKGINQYGKTFGLFFLLLTFFYFIGLITMLGVEFNAVIFPVPVEQPSGRGEPGRTEPSAPPQSGPEGEGKYWSPRETPARQPVGASAGGPSGKPAEQQERLPMRVPAFLVLLASAVVGLLIGRRASPQG
jgi:membrane protein